MSEVFTNKDHAFMQRALELAAKGRGSTSPNPMVGAVLVNEGRVVSEFYHRRPGGDHAEVGVLRGFDKKSLKYATLYVTLEPCCHSDKRTPPCTNFLISMGVKDIVVAVRDPNPLVFGRGINILRRAGIRVRVGLLADEVKRLNEVFFKTMEKGLPFVTLKLAMSLDARIAAQTGESRWITGVASRKLVHRMRSRHDAIITSSETVIMDNPHLGVRMVKGSDPFRVILDRHLNTSPGALVYRDKNVLVVTSTNASSRRLKLFERNDIDVLITPVKFRLKALLSDLLIKRGFQSVMIEAGGTLAASFIREKLIDRFMFFVAPTLIGSEGRSAVGELGFLKLGNAFRLKYDSVSRIGDDILIEAST